MDNSILAAYPANAKVPFSGPFYSLDKSEAFFPVVGYERLYKVSNLGRVMSARDSMNTRYGKMLKPDTSKDGYLRAYLRDNGKAEHKSVHRLVLETFIGPPPTKQHQAAHNDGDKSNNNVLNLRWATAKENTADRYLHGTILKGEDNARAKLNEAQVLYVHAAYQAGTSTYELSEELGVSQGQISVILSGKHWSHLGLKTEARNWVSEEQITKIFELHANRLPQRKIAAIVGCSAGHVCRILKNPQRKNSCLISSSAQPQ